MIQNYYDDNINDDDVVAGGGGGDGDDVVDAGGWSSVGFSAFYWTMMWGAENNTATVAIIVNSVKIIKQNLCGKEGEKRD